MVELYQFTNHRRNVDLEILFLGYERRYSAIEVEGIEFRPLEKEDKKLDMKNISNTDANWEEKLPADYEELIKWSKNSVQWTTEKEVYSILRRGFFINGGLEWFNLDKNGKKCHMVSAREANCIIGEMTFCMQTLPKSRFREAVVFKDWRFEIDREIRYQLVSSQTRYAIYLVYKLPKERSGFEAPMLAEDGLGSKCYIYLESPRTRVIRPKAVQNTYNSLNRPGMKTLPQQRDDGWMEVQIWEFETTTTMETIPINLQLTLDPYRCMSFVTYCEEVKGPIAHMIGLSCKTEI
ncbi:F-box protein VBF-like [Bidens hawaiensis]|uniref:F-box protein VBF-like n=1 Tax=Bidens hawaiensis TaxID=980011 RepID=UPI004048F8A1